MEKLISGIVKFQEQQFKVDQELFKNLAKGQDPEVLFITCSDSRIDPNLITQTKPGDLFIARNAGNLVPPHYSQATSDMDASIEFAMSVLGVRHIVICGHTDCGAMKGAIHPESVRHLHHVSSWLHNCAAAVAKVKARAEYPEGSHEQLLALIEENVVQQLVHLQTHPTVAAKLATGKLYLHGWVYDIENGQIYCYEDASRQWVPATEHYAHILKDKELKTAG